MNILGISCFYHDSATCLVRDGDIIAAAQEERFTRKKHDANFPINAIQYCLAEGKVSHDKLDAIAFYDKPILKFHRILETFLVTSPRGLKPFMKAIPLWLKEKLWIHPRIESELTRLGINYSGKVYFPEHHESHAASAFYPSPFHDAAILTLDGVGEWSTSTLGVGEGNQLSLLQEIRFPHSLGLLYSAFTYFTGFRVNSGEYKLMGLAPYGKGTYTKKIRDNLIDLKEDGSFRLNMEYFGYLDDLEMTNEKFNQLFDGPPRKPESPITVREMNLAKSIQEVTEEIVIRMGYHAKNTTQKDYLCLAGGVALNCVANGKLLQQGIFKDIWVQPAAGDAGGSLGAALAIWYNALSKPRTVNHSRDSMKGAYLGPAFSKSQIKEFLDTNGYVYNELSHEEWPNHIAKLIADEHVIGLFDGRMEFGPRSLGNRSIIGDARSKKMQSIMNLKIKFRESFRPFAPTCLEEKVSEYFEFDHPSPYMLMVAQVKSHRCFQSTEADEAERLADIKAWVNQSRSDIPAVTHVDYSARLQTVNKETNTRYHSIIQAFEKLTGCPVIINTSFNVRGEPIVCSPEDAYRCFMRTEMDYLILGQFVLKKTEQPRWQDKGNWKEEFTLD